MRNSSEKSEPLSNCEDGYGKGSKGKVNDGKVVVVAKRSAREVLLMFVLAVYGSWSVYHYQFGVLPTPLSAEQAGTRGFSEHEAMKHLKALTQFGPHPVGSDALDSAVQYVLQAAETIKEKAHLEVNVEVDLFHAKSGANRLNGGNFKGNTLVYSDLNHVVLRISPKNASEGKDNAILEGKENAILVSSHIDTVFSTEGAGDDTSNVAVMLELARGISQGANGFKNSVIFLFNTGEEEGLNGAHSFITQHPWSGSIQVAIDLEAMGIGGKSGIFQAGPHPWAIEKFAAVAKRPSGHIIAQDLFASGLINSATDFQVYKEVAGLSGLDFAYVDDTAVYHTKNDKLKLLKPGSLQHLGDNMLPFLLQAASSADFPEKNVMESDGNLSLEAATYFDILGMYMIVYRQRFATMLYSSVIILSLLIWIFSLLIGGYPAVVSLALSCLSVILMWLFSISFSASVAYILPFLSTSPVPFISSPWLVVGLFGAPALLGAFTGQHIGYLLLHAYLENIISKKGHLSSSIQDNLAKLDAERWLFKAGSFQWLILLVIGNYFKIGSSYLAVVWLISPAFAYGLLEATLSPVRIRKPLKIDTLLLALFVPFVISSGVFIQLAATVTGNVVRFERNPGANPEWLGSMTVAVYVAAVICLTMVYLLSYIHISDAKVPIIVGTCLLFGLSLVMLLVGIVSPFSEDTARAVNAVHVVDTTGKYSEKLEPLSYISFFSGTPGNLMKEVQLMEEQFICGRDKPLDFVTFSVKYGCWMDMGAEIGWNGFEGQLVHVESDIKGEGRITHVLIDTKGSTRWALGINAEVVEDFQLKDDAEELIPADNKVSVDGWHTIRFAGGKKSPTKFVLTLFWLRNQTEITYAEDSKKRDLLKLRTDVDRVTPAIDRILRKLPTWCSLFGKSTSPFTMAFLSSLPVQS